MLCQISGAATYYLTYAADLTRWRLELGRRTEVVGARSEDLDLENARWTIPGDCVRKGRLIEGRTKSGREKIVPLSTQAVTLFRRVADLAAACNLDKTRAAFLFPAIVAGGKYPHIAPVSITTAIRC